MRPRTLDEFVGQDEVLGPGKVLRTMIERDELRSAIFFGPPGCGKSTLAFLIAGMTNAHFETFSAVVSGIAEVRKAIEAARERLRLYNRRTILFIDEIHRFNKAQQDAFLPHVEDGTIILIGATTENPFFEIVGPLLSRSRLFRFEPISDEAMLALLDRAIHDEVKGLGKLGLALDDEAARHIVDTANGDARFALTALEWAGLIAAERDKHVTQELVEEAVQQRVVSYDRAGDQHYDIVSAFIKSLRGSDPDAALYWMQRMLQAGEDPRFICRRMVIMASEDIGMADPQALVIANAAAQALDFVGLPEAQIPMSQAAVHLATAPKSNAVYLAMKRAAADVKDRRPAPVPKPLRSTAYKGASKMGHGEGYLYPHDFPGGHVEQEYLPEDAASVVYYEPTEYGHEARIKQRLENWKKGES